MSRKVAVALALLATPTSAQGVRLDRDTLLVPGGFEAGRQPDGNSVVMAGPTGAIVFDTGRHRAHSDAVEAARAATGKPLVAIVNSHWHLDHVSGNLPLKAAHPAAKVYASDAIGEALTGFLKRSADGARAALAKGALPPPAAEEVRGDLATFAAGERLRPDIVIDRSRDVTLGGRALSLRLARRAATAGDLWVHDARRKRVLAGDLVTLPAPFMDTACPEGWRRALDEVATVRFTSLVPGHGLLLDRAGFDRYRRAFGRFVDCARGADAAAACAARWVADAGPLVTSAERPRAARMAAAYAAMIRSGSLDTHCAR